jgi:hypothetical protein
MAVSYGVLGVAVYLWLFSGMLYRSWPLRRTPVGFFVLASSLVFLISGLFNSQTLDAGMIFLLSVTVGLQPSFNSNNSIGSSSPTRIGSRQTEAGEMGKAVHSG